MAAEPTDKPTGRLAAFLAGGTFSFVIIGLAVVGAIILVAAVISLGAAFLHIANLGGAENQTNAVAEAGIAPPNLTDRATATTCLNQWISKKSGGKSPLQTMGANFIAATMDLSQQQESYSYNPALLVAIASMETSLALPPNRTVMDYNGVNAHNPFNITVANPKTEASIHLQDRNYKVFPSFEDSISYAGPYLARVYLKQGIGDLNSLELKYCGDPSSNKLCVPWLENVRGALGEITKACPEFTSASPSTAANSPFILAPGEVQAPLNNLPKARTYFGHYTFWQGNVAAYASDYGAAAGTPVYAIADGRAGVSTMHYQDSDANGCHAQPVGQNITEYSQPNKQNVKVFYAHIVPTGVLANARPGGGELGPGPLVPVRKGDLIARVYSQPCSHKPHLHFELNINGQPIRCTQFDLFLNTGKNRGCSGA